MGTGGEIPGIKQVQQIKSGEDSMILGGLDIVRGWAEEDGRNDIKLLFSGILC